MSERRRFWITLGGVILCVAAVIVLGPLAVLRIDLLDVGSSVDLSDRLKHLADTRTTLVQIIAGTAAAVGAYFTWRNFVRASGEAAEARAEAQENRAQATSARIAADYVKAVEQLGAENPVVRAGGALTLGRLLKAIGEDETEYWAIMDVLTAFVRERTRLGGKGPPAERGEQDQPSRAPDGDVEVALNVLARRTLVFRPIRADDPPTDLSGCDLSGAWLAGGFFQHAFFGGTRLIGASMHDGDFTGADLEGVDLSKADLRSAKLRQAKLTHAKLTHAKLDNADLTGADLRGACLAGASMRGAVLKDAMSEDAMFEGADLTDVVRS